MKGIGEMGGESSGASTVAADSVNVPDMRVSAGPGYVLFTDASLQGERTKATEEALSDSVFLGESQLEKPFEAHRKMLEEATDQKSFSRRTNAGDDTTPGASVSMMTWREGVAHTTFLGDAPVWVAEIDPQNQNKVTMHRLNPVTHVLDPFQPDKRIELHDGGGKKQALAARLLDPEKEPVNLNEYKALSYDNLQFLPKEHVATRKDFKEALARGSRLAVLAGTRGLVSSSDSLREEAEGIVDRFLDGNPRVSGGVDEVETFGEVFTSRNERGNLTVFEDVQEQYQQLFREFISTSDCINKQAEDIVERIIGEKSDNNEENKFESVFITNYEKGFGIYNLNNLRQGYRKYQDKEGFVGHFVDRVSKAIADERRVEYASERRLAAEMADRENAPYVRKMNDLREHYIQQVGNALRRYDAEMAAEDAYGEMLSYHLSQGGKLDDQLLAVKLNGRALMQAKNEGLDIKRRADFGFMVAELDPHKEMTVVAAEAGGPEAAPLVSRLKQIVSKRLELYESEGLKIPDSAAPLFQVETGLERIDERSEGSSSRRDDGSVSPVSEGPASSGSESGFSFSRVIPTEASMNAAELDGFDFVQAAVSDQGSLRPSSFGPSGRGLAGEAIELSFTDSFKYDWGNDSNVSGSEKPFSFGDKERDGAEMGSLFSPGTSSAPLFNISDVSKLRFDLTKSASLVTDPKTEPSSSVMLPSNYGGDARVAAGENYVAFTDSGGVSKNHGINHDRVAAGETSYENPLKVHFDIIDQAEKLAAGVNQGESKKNASGSTLSIVTWKDNEALTTYLGDSPVWVMEVKADGEVKLHLLNPEMHNYDPLNSNEVMYRVDGSAKDNILDMLQASPVQILTEGGPAGVAEGNQGHVFSTRKNFSKELEAKSRLYVLAGSDGLLDHVGAQETEIRKRIVDSLKGAEDSGVINSQESSAESLALRQRVVEYYIDKKLSEEELTDQQKQQKALSDLRDWAVLGQKPEDDFDALTRRAFVGVVINSFVATLAAEETRAQLKQAEEIYAHLLEDHLNAGGAANDSALAVKMNGAATRMHAASGKVSENPSYETNPIKKDNTGFIILRLEEGKQVTALVADGNREFGDVVSSIIRDVARSFFAVPYDMPGLKKPHSAEPVYAELNKGRRYTEARPDYWQQDALVALRSGNLKQYLRERDANPDLPARQFFEARQAGQGGGGPVQKRNDEITEEPRSSARRDEAPGSNQAPASEIVDAPAEKPERAVDSREPQERPATLAAEQSPLAEKLMSVFTAGCWNKTKAIDAFSAASGVVYASAKKVIAELRRTAKSCLPRKRSPSLAELPNEAVNSRELPKRPPMLAELMDEHRKAEGKPPHYVQLVELFLAKKHSSAVRRSTSFLGRINEGGSSEREQPGSSGERKR